MSGSNLRTKADLNGLQVFDAVMAEQNMTRAAMRLFMTPSSVSHAISRLKVAVGDELFVRTTTGVRPTKRALELWRTIDEPMRTLQSAIGKDVFDAHRAKFEVRISLNDMLAKILGPELLTLFGELAPNADLSLRQRRSMEDETRIRAGLLDFAIGATVSQSSDLRYLRFWEDEYFCVFRREHPARKTLSSNIETFLSFPYIAVIPDGETPAAADLALRDLGFQPSRRVVVGTFSCVPDILRRTDCVSLMPGPYISYVLNQYPELIAKRHSFALRPLLYFLIWHERSERNRARDWTLAQLRSFLKEKAPQHLAECPQRSQRNAKKSV